MAKRNTEVTPSHFELVGHISALWAVLELNFEATIWMLLEDDTPLLACVTSQFSSYYPKLKAVTALCEAMGVSGETVKKLKSFQGRLADVAERRNRAIHDAWATRDGSIVGKVQFSTAKAPGPATIEELRALSNSIKKELESFKSLRTTILRELGPLLKMRSSMPRSKPVWKDQQN